MLRLLVFALLLCPAAVCAQSNASDGSIRRIAERARNLSDSGEWEQARKLLTSEISKAIKKKDSVAEARLKAAYAVYTTDRNTYFSADENGLQAALQEARSVVEKSGDKVALSTLEQAEGRFTYWQAMSKKGAWEPPTQHFDRALKVAEELGDQHALGWALFYRGLVEQQQDRPEPARKLFDRALEQSRRNSDQRLESFVVRHIAYLQQEAKQVEEARTNFQRSLELRERNGMKVFVPFAMIALANFEKEQGETQKAIATLERAIRTAKLNNSPRSLYLGQISLAKVYGEAGRKEEARRLAEQSRAGAEAFGSPDSVKEAADFLQKLAESK